MFCPNCGAQQPDGAQFCSVCGGQMTGQQPQAAQGWNQQQAWGGQTQVRQPVQQAGSFAGQRGAYPGQQAYPGQSAPGGFGARRGFGGLAASKLSGLAAGHGPLAGKRSLTLILGSILLLLFMLQGWIGMPWIEKALNLAATTSGANGFIPSDYINSVGTSVIKTSYHAMDLPGLAGALSALQATLQNITQMGAFSGTMPGATQLSQTLSSLGIASMALYVAFVLWIICMLGLIVGLVLKLLRGDDTVLFIAVCATAAISLLSVIVILVLNAQIEGNLNAALTGTGAVLDSQTNTFIKGIIPSIKPFLAPGIGVILSLVASIATAITSLLMKE